MKKLLVGLASLPLLASVAVAGQPTPLVDAQMDKVSAGAIEYNLPGVEIVYGLHPENTVGFPQAITLQTPVPDPHTYCQGCSPPNYESTQPTTDYTLVQGSLQILGPTIINFVPGPRLVPGS